MKDVLRSLWLVPALFRFVADEVARGRSAYFAAVLALFAVVEFTLNVAWGSAEGFGSRFMLVTLLVSAPFCRSWLDEDVRLGYAALWLQKPVRALDFYLARILAVVAWSVVVPLVLGLTSMPAAIAGLSLLEIVHTVVGVGWVPTLLVVLCFLGSALGARNGGLFAYGVVFAGFMLPGFREALWLGPAYGVLEVVLPPVDSALEAMTAFRDGNLPAGAAELWPLLVYSIVCTTLALSLAVQAPKRLARSE
jgi:hypothetical protein